MTFAVIKTGGKQYKVAANDVLKIEKIAGEPGDVVTFDQVLMVGNGGEVTVGTPLVEGALVAGHFVSTDKQRTVLIVKKHRRQHYDRRNGHRQLLSTVRITEILTGGAKPTTTADDRLKARHAAKSAPVAEVTETKAPARKAAKKAAAAEPAEVPAETAAEAEAPTPETETKAPARKAAAKKAAEAGEKKPAAKKAAKKAAATEETTEKKPAARKKAAPKADQE